MMRRHIVQMEDTMKLQYILKIEIPLIFLDKSPKNFIAIMRLKDKAGMANRVDPDHIEAV